MQNETIENGPPAREITASAGHRERLRQKFLKAGLAGFHDYEIVELLLTLGMPRKDCKPLARELLGRYKTLRGVLEADPDELKTIKGLGDNNIFGIRFAAAIAERLLKEKAVKGRALKDSRGIFDYLYVAMRDLKKEIFKVVFLDAQNQILAIEDLFEGTVDASSVYPREIMERALKFKAVGVVCVHNHPTGNPTPSDNDRQVTMYLVAAGMLLGIRVMDHVIIGDNAHYSFADQGLIAQYERKSEIRF